MKANFGTKDLIERLSPIVRLLSAGGKERLVRFEVFGDNTFSLEGISLSGELTASMLVKGDANVDKAGVALVEGASLLDALKTFDAKAGTCSVLLDTTKLHLVSGKAKFRLNTVNLEEWSAFGQPNVNATLRLSFADLNSLIAACAGILPKQGEIEVPVWQRGYYLSVLDGKVEILAGGADGMARARAVASAEGNFPSMLLPTLFWEQIGKLDVPDEAAVLFTADTADPSRVRVILPGVILNCLALDSGKPYPQEPIQKVCSPTGALISFDKAEMERALKGAILIRKPETVTQVAGLNGVLHLGTFEDGNTHEVDLAYAGDPFALTLKADKLVKAITVCDEQATCYLTPQSLAATGGEAIRAIPLVNRK